MAWQLVQPCVHTIPRDLRCAWAGRPATHPQGHLSSADDVGTGVLRLSDGHHRHPLNHQTTQGAMAGCLQASCAGALLRASRRPLAPPKCRPPPQLLADVAAAAAEGGKPAVDDGRRPRLLRTEAEMLELMKEYSEAGLQPNCHSRPLGLAGMPAPRTSFACGMQPRPLPPLPRVPPAGAPDPRLRGRQHVRQPATGAGGSPSAPGGC